LQDHLAAFLAPRARAGDLLLIAFSGGPDSTALLAGTADLARLRGLRVLAAHLDHGLDTESAARAERARRLASRLGVEIVVDRREVTRLRRRGESCEEAARRVRYEFLEECRDAAGARWILTAHHLDDQAETLVMRLRQGSGLSGLVGVRAQLGHLLRPLLALPRTALEAECRRRGLTPNDDPGNRDVRAARAFVRSRLLPALAASDPEIAIRLAAVAAAAARALPALERRLEAALQPKVSASGVLVDRLRLRGLPDSALSAAFGWLSRIAGARHAPSRRAREELRRQLRRAGAIGCDGGAGWYWASRGEGVALLRAPGPTPAFTYTFAVPGHCDIPEIGRRLSVEPSGVAAWMRVGDGLRAGLATAIPPGAVVEVRNRRPGDRVHPLGAPGERKLKDVLVDRRIPRAERDRIPLLCFEGRIAWVPGVTIDERFRLPLEGDAWVARIEER
jgi:tRNA(Ile)-lysidine synthase